MISVISGYLRHPPCSQFSLSLLIQTRPQLVTSHGLAFGGRNTRVCPNLTSQMDSILDILTLRFTNAAQVRPMWLHSETMEGLTDLRPRHLAGMLDMTSQPRLTINGVHFVAFRTFLLGTVLCGGRYKKWYSMSPLSCVYLLYTELVTNPQVADSLSISRNDRDLWDS